jgi:hypothetical protein
MVKDHEKTNELIELGLQYKFSIAELSKKFGLSNRTISKILKENGWSPNFNSSLIRMRKNGTDIENLAQAATYYVNNKVTFQDVMIKYGVSCENLRKYLFYIGKLPDKFSRKSRQKTWNTGLSKYSDNRVASYAKNQSKETYIHGYKKIWSDELKKSVIEHHYVWFKNTGYWPNTLNKEQIHHIDGNKLNNNFNNLVLTSISEHSIIHKKYEDLVFRLLRAGYIEYDKTTNNLIEDTLWKKLEK